MNVSSHSRKDEARTPLSFDQQIKPSLAIEPNLRSPLVKLDLKTDTLNLFLQEVSNILNDHSRLIKSLQIQMSKRVHDTQLGDLFSALSLSPSETSLLPQFRGDKLPHSQTLTLTEDLYAGRTHYKDFQNLQKGATQFADKLYLIGETMGHLVNTRSNIFQMIQSLDTKIDTRVSIQRFKAKLKRRKVKWLNKFKDCEQLIVEHAEQIRAKVMNMADDLKGTMDNKEDRYADRIQELRQEINKRCTSEYVEAEIKEMEERAYKQFITRQRDTEDKLENARHQFNRTLRELESKQNARYRNIKQRIEAIENWKAGVIFKQRFEDHIQSSEAKHIEIQNTFNLHSSHLKNFETELQRLSQWASKAGGTAPRKTSESIIDSLGVPSRPTSAVPMHRKQESISHLYPPPLSGYSSVNVQNSKMMPTPQIDLSKYDNLNDKFKGHLQNFDNMLLEFQKMQNDMQTLNLKIFDVAAGLEMKAERDDIIGLPFLREDVDLLKTEIDKQAASTKNSHKGLELKIKKLNPEPHLKKIHQRLNAKAGHQEVGKALQRHDHRMNGIDLSVNSLYGEMEQVVKSIKSAQSSIAMLGLAQSDILAGTRSVNCLVCGRNQVGNVILNSPEHRGKRVYSRAKPTTAEVSKPSTVDSLRSSPLLRNQYLQQHPSLQGGGPKPLKAIYSQQLSEIKPTECLSEGEQRDEATLVLPSESLRLSRKKSAPAIPKLSLIRNETIQEINMEDREDALNLQSVDMGRKNHWPNPATDRISDNSLKQVMTPRAGDSETVPAPKAGIMESFLRSTFNDKFIKRHALTGRLEGKKAALRPKPH